MIFEIFSVINICTLFWSVTLYSFFTLKKRSVPPYGIRFWLKRDPLNPELDLKKHLRWNKRPIRNRFVAERKSFLNSGFRRLSPRHTHWDHNWERGNLPDSMGRDYQTKFVRPDTHWKETNTPANRRDPVFLLNMTPKTFIIFETEIFRLPRPRRLFRFPRPSTVFSKINFKQNVLYKKNKKIKTDLTKKL